MFPEEKQRYIRRGKMRILQALSRKMQYTLPFRHAIMNLSYYRRCAVQSIVLTDHTGARAEILPEKGATVISYRSRGQEVFYRDQENLDSPERPRCGVPFLFPVFGRCCPGRKPA